VPPAQFPGNSVLSADFTHSADTSLADTSLVVPFSKNSSKGCSTIDVDQWAGVIPETEPEFAEKEMSS